MSEDMPIGNQPFFSICIPNFNYERYLGETIQSVLDQTHPYFEIIVVDNDSTDHSVEVVMSFKDERIHLYRNLYNVGFAPNLDRAASKANNPYIIMLSSDDLMRPTALEEYARVIQSLGTDAEHTLIVSAYHVIDGKSQVKELRDRAWHYSIPINRALTESLADPLIEAFDGLAVFKDVFPRMGVPGPFCSTLYSRQLFDRVGGYSSHHPIGPDAHLAYKSMLLGAHVIFVNRPLFAYRVHDTNQVTQSRQAKTLKVPIDRYFFTIQYSDEELSRAGVKREEIVEFLVDETCLKSGLVEICEGTSTEGIRMLFFSLAAYPAVTLRNWKTYALFLLWVLGPVGPPLARWLYGKYPKQKNGEME